MGLIDGTFTKDTDFIDPYSTTNNGSVNYLGTFVVQSGANMLDELKINIKMMDWHSITASAVEKVEAQRTELAGEDVTFSSAIAEKILAVDVTENIATKNEAFVGNVTNRVTLHSQLSSSMAISVVNAAINIVSTQRSELGALQNRLEFKIQNLNISAENLQAAESRIRDADMAKMMTEFTKNNILFQASTAMLAQANALPQSVLQLLG
jgi:flagellin-like hook-associated protein FlgL